MQKNARLKIWVCEFVSAGGLAAEALPQSLLQEGLLMRDALLSQLHALGIDCITSHDVRVPAPLHTESVPVAAHEDAWSLWAQQLAANGIDACWVVAPETEHVLYRLAQLVAQSGKRWLGCEAAAIMLATDKAQLAEHCVAWRLPVLPHQHFNAVTPASLAAMSNGHGWVVKPRDGAGCDHTYYLKNIQDVIDFKREINHTQPGLSSRLLLQPYLPGQALSMSVISTRHRSQVIAAHHQRIVIAEGCITFHGAGIHQAAQYLPQMQVLADQLQQAIPGLHGYWGADLILTSAQTLVLVEINPRLTTPFIALSRVMAQNPAALVLDAVLQQQLPTVTATQGCEIDLSHGVMSV